MVLNDPLAQAAPISALECTTLASRSTSATLKLVS
jgi:hypothetical protein